MQKIQSAPDRRWSKDVAPGDEIRALYLIGSASQLQAKNGPFWRLELKDASGDLEARIWSPLSQQFAEIPSGVIAEVEGRAESFRDKLQVNVNALRVLSPEETASVDTSVFMASSSRPPQEMLDELEALCRKEFTYKPWRKFILSVLEDEAIRVPLLNAPAAKSVHHAWVGGLLEHTLSVATLCLRFCDHYPDLDRQTLLAGAICHDLGKIWEFSGGLANDYTDAGRLVGHINLCLGKLDRHLAKSGLDEELILHFQHLILSHHGLYEYGSPRLPQTAEAFALHYADNIDAKITQSRSLFGELEDGESGWSPYQKSLERPLFQAPKTPEAPHFKAHGGGTRSPKVEPVFITLEGIEGSGKTTLIENLADVFRTLNHEVLVTREPGGCALGRELRQMLLNPETEICPEAELFLFLADRAQHVAEVIRPALKRGEVVLCDRYADSTVVYQGYGRGLDIEKLRSLNDVAIGGLWPDRTFVLDMDPADALKRARRRNAELGLSEKEGRFEAEQMPFHTRIREGFKLWAAHNTKRIVVLDAADSPEGLMHQALANIDMFE